MSLALLAGAIVVFVLVTLGVSLPVIGGGLTLLAVGLALWAASGLVKR